MPKKKKRKKEANRQDKHSKQNKTNKKERTVIMSAFASVKGIAPTSKQSRVRDMKYVNRC
jgi:hypothetical protein